MHQVEEAVPPGQTKKMHGDVQKRSHPIGDRFWLAVIFWHVEGPEHNQRTPNDIFFWHKAPIAAVQAVIAIITHSEVMVGRNHDLVIMNVCLQRCCPFRRNLASAIAKSGGEFIAVRIVSSVANYIGLGLTDSIQIDHTITKPEPVARHTNDALYQIYSLF